MWQCHQIMSVILTSWWLDTVFSVQAERFEAVNWLVFANSEMSSSMILSSAEFACTWFFVLLVHTIWLSVSSQYLYLLDCSPLTGYDASGVQIIEDESEGITMELEMQWDGNPNIILDIKTYLGVGLPVQVSRVWFSNFYLSIVVEISPTGWFWGQTIRLFWSAYG